MNIDPKYTSDPILLDSDAEISENVLHYVVVSTFSDGTTVVTPTQGMIKNLGETKYGQMWAYLRWNCKPFYVILFGGSTLDTISERDIPPELVEEAMETARTIEVYDRRHLRTDQFSTPGEPSLAAQAYDGMLSNIGVRTT